MNDSFNREHEVINEGTFHNVKGDNKMTNTILIHKEAGTKKDAFRVRQDSYIPDLSKRENRKLNKKSTNKRGESNMKRKMGVMLVVIIMTTALTGCVKSLMRDENHAKVSWYTTSGMAANTRSFNGAGMTTSGQDIALRNKAEFVLKKGDKLHLTFECEACGDVQEFDIDEVWSKTISCKCPEKIDDNGNAKEFYSVSVTFEE